MVIDRCVSSCPTCPLPATPTTKLKLRLPVGKQCRNYDIDVISEYTLKKSSTLLCWQCFHEK